MGTIGCHLDMQMHLHTHLFHHICKQARLMDMPLCKIRVYFSYTAKAAFAEAKMIIYSK